MASSEKTEKSRYPSKYSPGVYVTAEQFIAELICERMAKWKKVTLGVKFWEKDDFWLQMYKMQLRYAHSLTKLYLPESVSIFLRSKEGLRVCTLRHEWIDKAVALIDTRVRADKASIAFKANEIPEILPCISPTKPREPFVPSKSVLSKLKDL